MLITAAIGCLLAAAYLDWCEARDAYLDRLRERFKQM